MTLARRVFAWGWKSAAVAASAGLLGALLGLGLGLRLGESHLAEPPVASGNAWGQHSPQASDAPAPPAPVVRPSGPVRPNLRPSVAGPLTPNASFPTVAGTAYVDPLALLLGAVEIGERAFVGPFVSIRADEGEPIFVGAESNVQDGAVIHGLPTQSSGEPIDVNRYRVEGRDYSVYLGEQVSVEHQAQVHGPAWIEREVWVGMQALVWRAHVGPGVVIEPRASVIGVRIPPDRYVPAGVVVNRQDIADRLPEITPSYPLRKRNRGAVHASRSLARGYLQGK